MNELLIPWMAHTEHGLTLFFHNLSQVDEEQLVCLITDIIEELAERRDTTPATVMIRFLHNYAAAADGDTIERIQRN